MNLLKCHGILYLILLFSMCSTAQKNYKTNNPYYQTKDTQKVNIHDTVWAKVLDSKAYYIAREKGTEYAFSGQFWNHFEKGLYHCKACGNPLFQSDAKFESHCGWPSFFEPVQTNSILFSIDTSYQMNRTEVTCGRCGAHLGHVFDDGPPPSHKRYCINSVILNFEKK